LFQYRSNLFWNVDLTAPSGSVSDPCSGATEAETGRQSAGTRGIRLLGEPSGDIGQVVLTERSDVLAWLGVRASVA
jgi:hypothetical protein